MITPIMANDIYRLASALQHTETFCIMQTCGEPWHPTDDHMRENPWFGHICSSIPSLFSKIDQFLWLHIHTMVKRKRNISRQSVLHEQEDNITVWMNGGFNMSLHGSIKVVIFRACFKFQRSIKFLEVLHYGEKNYFGQYCMVILNYRYQKMKSHWNLSILDFNLDTTKSSNFVKVKCKQRS